MQSLKRRKTGNLIVPNLFTVPEAAWAANTEDRFVNGEVDQKIVVVRSAGKRMLAQPDILYLSAVCEVGRDIGIKLRRHIYAKLNEALTGGNCRRVTLGFFELRLDDLLAQVDSRLADIRAARDLVISRAGVRGGDPVIRGTRIPVRMLSEMTRNGVESSEIEAEYDLSAKQVELALLYDKLHPRRGRPQIRGGDANSAEQSVDWREDIEALGEYKPT